MKKIILSVLVVCAIAATSFKLSIDKTSATVQTVDGLQVFAFAKPTAKYDILGMVEVKGIVKNERAPHMVELLVKYAKEKNPSGEAIIVGSTFFNAEVIRFKE